MASGLTRYAERHLLDHMLKGTSYTQATHLYVELYTTAPTSSTAGTICADANYVHQTCDTWDAATSADPAVAQNTGALDFPAMAASQNIVAVGVSDGTNVLAWTTCSFTAGVGVIVHFDAGAVKVRMNYTA